MKSRPIIYSTDMVRAIYADQKDRTRRVLNPLSRGYPIVSFERWAIPYKSSSGEVALDYQYDKNGYPLWASTEEDGTNREWHCPYGEPGDQLWVREGLYLGKDHAWHYRADDALVYGDEVGVAWAHHKETPFCSARFMPKWASRLTLKVTDVSVKRLQSITEEEAKREGAAYEFAGQGLATRGGHRVGFANLWNKLNAKRGYGWDINPWVWVVAFERMKGVNDVNSRTNQQPEAWRLQSGHDLCAAQSETPSDDRLPVREV